MDFNLSIPVKVISGKKCVINNSEKFKQFGKTCLIVTGGSSAEKSGALADVKEALTKEEINFEVFNEVSANPLLSVCHKGGKIAREISAEFIVGIGGGSALDAAKAVAVFATNKSFGETDIYNNEKRNRALPLVLIGTTAGTGSEVGRVSVLTNDKTGRKKSIAPDECNPSLTFADSTYTHSMPYSVTVSTALDALSHAVEGYFSSKCTDIPTLFAEKGILLIWNGLKLLEKTKEVPDEKTREELYYGSLYAGITLAYCGTAFPHPLGYILTENFGVPHGMACAEFMPELLGRAEQFENEKLQKLLSLTGETKETFIALIEKLTDVGDIKMTKEEAKNFCSRFEAAIPNNFKFSPGGFSMADALGVFEKKFCK